MQPRKFEITAFITEDTRIFGTTVGKFSKLISKEFEKQFALHEAFRKNLAKPDGSNTDIGKQP